MNSSFKIIIILIFLMNFYSQEAEITIGQHFSLDSKHLGGEREYFINLPKDYQTSGKEYPTLYVLDGQRYFTSAVAIQHALGNSTDVPEMIIVGIKNVYSRRRDMQWENKEIYASFFADELIPLIDKTYRTNSVRLIFGWENGGFFSSYLLLQKDQLFDAAIASNGAMSDESIIDEFIQLNKTTDKYLYLANSIQDIFSIDASNALVGLLEKKAIKQLIWKNEEFNSESHASLPYLALYHGLRYYYYNYNSYKFYSIKQYEEIGGIPAIKQYFKARAKRFGFPDKIDDSTKNTLIWLTWRRDNFKYFDFFMTEFKDVLSTKRYQSNYWQNRLGQFYLKYKSYDKAKTHFLYGIEQFSGSAEIFSGLAKVNIAQNDKNKAQSNLKKAVEIAKQNSDEDLQKYKTELAELEDI